MRDFSRTQKILIILCFVLFSAQAFSLMRDKSATADAIAFHTVNGYAYLKTQDYRMNPAMPPLLRQWMALPWLFFNPTLDLDKAAWQEADSVPFALGFLFKDNLHLVPALLLSSKLMMFLLSCVLAGGVVLWAKQLYGASSAVFALGLFTFSPMIVAYSALANVDNGVALFYFLTVYFLYRDALNTEKRFPWKVSLCLGLVLASKYTGILLIPILLWVFLRHRGWVRGSGVFLGVVGFALAVIWSAYCFEVKPLLQNVPRVDEKVNYIAKIADTITLGNTDAREFFIHSAHEWPLPLSSWILGFAGIVRSHRAEYSHYFMGEWIHHGVWYHYLFSFAVKSTIAFLVLIGTRVLTLVGTVPKGDSPKRGLSPFGTVPDERANADFYLLAPVLILFLATFFDSTGVGIRYLIPVYPFLFVWVSGLWRLGDGKRWRFIRWGCVGLLIFHALSSLAQFPNHLQYFNGLIGGPRNAYRYVRANDLEWGQELKNLGRYSKRHGISRMKHQLFGTYDAAYYGIPGEPATEKDYQSPEKVVYAVSVFHLDRFRWARDIEPNDRIGDVIFIYDFRSRVTG